MCRALIRRNVMWSSWKRMLGLSLVCFLATQALYAQSQGLTFNGKVVDDQGQALAGASVYFVGVLNAPRFHPHEVKVLREKTTLSDGRFVFSQDLFDPDRSHPLHFLQYPFQELFQDQVQIHAVPRFHDPCCPPVLLPHLLR